MRYLSRTLILVALVFSIYLAVVSFTSGSIAGCGGGTPCDKVLNSEWSYIGHVPVSLPAVLIYGILLLLQLSGRTWKRLDSVMFLGMVTAIVLVVLWFVYLQVVVLKQICPFCMTSHTCGALGSILYAVEVHSKSGGGISRGRFMQGAVIGMLFAGGFVVLQLKLPKPDRSVIFDVETETIPAEPPHEAEEKMPKPVERTGKERVSTKETEAVAEQKPEVIELPAKVEEMIREEPEELVEEAPVETIEGVEELIEVVESMTSEEPVPVYSIHGGAFTFPMDEIPGIGDWKAPNIMLNLIDFACDHCREHYRVLRKRAPWYEGEIFFGVMPLALNERCNPYFSMPGLPDYANCEYARLALAVWRMAPDKYPEYVDWLCEESSPPASLDASQWPIAREYAQDLVGEDLLEAGWDDPWVNEMMQTLTELYGYNLKLTGQAAIPQQFLNQKLRFGEITTESSFNMIMGLNFPIEIRRRR